MDAITEIAFNIKNDFLTSVSLLINDNVVFFLLIIALLFVAEKRNSKRLKVLSALLLVAVLTFGLKETMAIERPCVPLGLPYCPEEYSFPSIHAALAFTLMVSFLDKKSYPYFVLFAFFVAFSRLNLAVHNFRDIAGALPIALIVYYIVDILWRRYYER
jgi:undecaprenyl-diphosphatase